MSLGKNVYVYSCRNKFLLCLCTWVLPLMLYAQLPEQTSAPKTPTPGPTPTTATEIPSPILLSPAATAPEISEGASTVTATETEKVVAQMRQMSLLNKLKWLKQIAEPEHREEWKKAILSPEDWDKLNELKAKRLQKEAVKDLQSTTKMDEELIERQTSQELAQMEREILNDQHEHPATEKETENVEDIVCQPVLYPLSSNTNMLDYELVHHYRKINDYLSAEFGLEGKNRKYSNAQKVPGRNERIRIEGISRELRVFDGKKSIVSKEAFYTADSDADAICREYGFLRGSFNASDVVKGSRAAVNLVQVNGAEESDVKFFPNTKGKDYLHSIICWNTSLAQARIYDSLKNMFHSLPEKNYPAQAILLGNKGNIQQLEAYLQYELDRQADKDKGNIRAEILSLALFGGIKNDNQNLVLQMIEKKFIGPNTLREMYGFEEAVTPLMVATRLGKIDLMEKLIQSGSDVNVTTAFGRGAIDYVEYKNFNRPFYLLAEHGAKFARLEGTESNFYHFAAQEGELQWMQKMWPKKMWDINQRNHINSTPLTYAISNKHPDMALWLLDQEEVQVPESGQKDPLLLALKNNFPAVALKILNKRKGDTKPSMIKDFSLVQALKMEGPAGEQMVQLLLAAGARPWKIVNKSVKNLQVSALDMALALNKKDVVAQMLQLYPKQMVDALQKKSEVGPNRIDLTTDEQLKKLLLDHGAATESSRKQQRHPLGQLIKEGILEKIEKMQQYLPLETWTEKIVQDGGVDYTPMQWYIHTGNDDLAVWLLQKGGKENIFYSHKSKDDKTSDIIKVKEFGQLARAIQKDMWRTANMMIELGWPLNKGVLVRTSASTGKAPAEEMLFPLDLAMQKGRRDLEALLRQKGALTSKDKELRKMPLEVAMQMGQWDLFKKLILQEKEGYFLTTEGESFIQWLIEHDQEELLDWAMAKIDSKELAFDAKVLLMGRNPLEVVLAKDRPLLTSKIYNWLNKLGIPAVDEQQMKAMGVQSFNPYLLALKNSPESLEYLIDQLDPAVPLSQNYFFLPIIRELAELKDKAEIYKKLLVKVVQRKANVNFVHFNGRLNQMTVLDIVNKDLKKIFSSTDQDLRPLLRNYGALTSREIQGNISPYLNAALHGNVDRWKELEKNKIAGMMQKDSHGRSPLWVAINANDENMLQTILTSMAQAPSDLKRKLKEFDVQGYSPLTLAVFYNWQKGVDLLLAAGAEVDGRDRNGYSPIIMASMATHGNASAQEIFSTLLKNSHVFDNKMSEGWDALLGSITFGHYDWAKKLLQSGMSLNSSRFPLETLTELDVADRLGLNEATLKWIKENGGMKSEWIKKGYSAIGVAIEAGDFDLVQKLHQAGTGELLFINPKTSETGLHYALKGKAINGPMLDWLREKMGEKFDPLAEDFSKRNAFDVALQEGNAQGLLYLLQHLTPEQKAKLNFQELLEKVQKSKDILAMHPVLTLLRQQGILTSAEEGSIADPFVHALIRGEEELARQFFPMVGENAKTWSYADQFGNDILHYAAKFFPSSPFFLEMVQKVLEREKTVNWINKDKKTPLDLALASLQDKNPLRVQQLRDFGLVNYQDLPTGDKLTTTSALSVAIAKNEPDRVFKLIERLLKRSDSNPSNIWTSALKMALKQPGGQELAELMIDHKDFKLDPTDKEIFGLAVSNDNVWVAQKLLDHMNLAQYAVKENVEFHPFFVVLKKILQQSDDAEEGIDSQFNYFVLADKILTYSQPLNFYYKGSTPLQVVVNSVLETIELQGKPLSAERRYEWEQIISKMVAQGADINAPYLEEDEVGETVLHSFFGKNAIKATLAPIWDLLRDHGALTKAEIAAQDTPLHLSVRSGNILRTQTLLSLLNYDVLAKNKKGDNIFHLALRNKNLTMLSILLKTAPSFANIPDGQGHKPLRLAISYGASDEILELLQFYKATLTR